MTENQIPAYCAARNLPRFESMDDLSDERALDFARFIAAQVEDLEHERQVILKHLGMYASCPQLRKLRPRSPLLYAQRLLALEERVTVV